MNRKSAPKVKDGKVQKKNRTALSPDYYLHDLPELEIDRQRPGRGAQHLLTVSDIRRFISIIPRWDSYCPGLRAVILTPYDDCSFGRYNEVGLIKISAWPDYLWVTWDDATFTRRSWLLDLLYVEIVGFECRLTVSQAKGVQLLDTFLHELGHHVDRMTTRRQRHSDRGEAFAERFGRELALEMWEAYVGVFGT